MSQPNILLFLTDDHGAWANACYGNTEVISPHLDQLAERGTRFENVFTPTPVCSAARACLLTGRAPSQVGIHDWLDARADGVLERAWLQDEQTLFDLFKAAGYTTGLSGKWHLGWNPLKPSGLDFYFGFVNNQGGHNGTNLYTLNDEEISLTGNKSGYISDQAINFLESVPEDEPFFLSVGYIATHSPYNQQSHNENVTSLYQNTTFRDIPEYSPHPWVKNEGMPAEPDTEQLRDSYIGYYAAVTEVDNNVGRLLDYLNLAGKLDNTIVIYTADHGCAIGHHGFYGKGNSTRPLNMYETSLRVPLIWAGPGIKAGQVIENCVDHYDTFCAILQSAGIIPATGRNYPGTSYVPQLQGQSVAWDDITYGEYGDLRVIRTPEWKLIWRYQTGPHELFDLKNDPGETVNLFDQYPVIANELKAKLEAFYAKYDDPAKSGLRVKELPKHNRDAEAWRDGLREARGLQIY